MCHTIWKKELEWKDVILIEKERERCRWYKLKKNKLFNFMIGVEKREEKKRKRIYRARRKKNIKND